MDTGPINNNGVVGVKLISPIDATSSDDDDNSPAPASKRRRSSSEISSSASIAYDSPMDTISPATTTTYAYPNVITIRPPDADDTAAYDPNATALPASSANDPRYVGSIADTAIYDSQDNFKRLSDELVLNIFSQLPKKALIRCGQVCRRFNYVSLDESLWTRLDLGGRSVRPAALGRAISRGLVVLRLAQTTIAGPVYGRTDTQAGYRSRLQYLDLSMANIGKDALLELLGSCRQLKKLSLEHVAVDGAICAQIAANREMEVLNLTMAEGVRSSGLRMMLANLDGLQTLNLAWTGMDSEAVLALVECAPRRLLRLNVAGCRKSMTDLMLFHLVRRCPELIELDLSDCSVLTSEAIGTVCGLKSLEYLSLSRCYNIAVAAYLTINELLSLAYLDIFGVLSDQALTLLQSSFPSVTINKFMHSSVARPTVGTRRTSVWGQRTRD